MNAALVVIDMQNGFVHPEGSVCRLGITLCGMAEVIERTASLIARARECGVPVVYIRHVFSAGMRDMPKRWRESVPPGTEMLLRDSWDAAVHDAIAPQPDDVIVDKNRFDAFLYTDLEVQLRALAVSRVLVAGVATPMCVETTVRSGDQRDLDMFVAADCVSGPDELHQASLTAMAATCATVLPGLEALGQLTRSH